MIKKIKEWFMDEVENNEDVVQKVVLYEVHNYDQLDKIGESIKSKYFVICIIDENCLVRTLDFISGITFVIDIQKISLSQNIYLFFPCCFDYKFIS